MSVYKSKNETYKMYNNKNKKGVHKKNYLVVLWIYLFYRYINNDVLLWLKNCNQILISCSHKLYKVEFWLVHAQKFML